MEGGGGDGGEKGRETRTTDGRGGEAPRDKVGTVCSAARSRFGRYLVAPRSARQYMAGERAQNRAPFPLHACLVDSALCQVPVDVLSTYPTGIWREARHDARVPAEDWLSCHGKAESHQARDRRGHEFHGHGSDDALHMCIAVPNGGSQLAFGSRLYGACTKYGACTYISVGVDILTGMHCMYACTHWRQWQPPPFVSSSHEAYKVYFVTYLEHMG